MLEKAKQIPAKILEWWKKFSTKQKMLIISSVSVVVVALVILGVVLSTPKMVVLKECENTKEAAQVKKILEDNNVKYEITSDGLVFSIRQEDEAGATLLLAENNITAYDYEWENLNNVFEGGFSATEADKSKKYQLWMENDLEEKLATLTAVERAEVTLNVPVNDGTLISKDEETSAWVILNLNSELEDTTAQGLGRAIATALGNETTNNITILDSDGNVLFSGGEDSTSAGAANSNLEVKNNAERQVASQVRQVVMETNVYDSVSVAPNLDIEYTDTNVTDHEYYLGTGLESALPGEERHYSQTTEGGGVTGVPGTDSNDGTTYVTRDGNNGSSETTEDEISYQNSERITNETTTMGRPNYETSSLAVVASSYHVYNEDELRSSGQLDGMTFEEFKAANEARIRLDVEPELVTMVSKATGIPEANISMVAYEVPLFNPSDNAGRNLMDFLPIILAALIMIMLGYVVFRSTRKEPEPEMEPELSVETLLESTKEAQENLEDIGFSEKSEIRVLIEKFVDENPEAAASLLRNWLNEEWE